MLRRLFTIAAVTAVSVSGTALSGVTSSAAATKPLRVLVTNDDGVKAPGIDVLVQALRKLPNTTVIVVAPLANQSGTGVKTTPGKLTVTNATTASGYKAKAVKGYPADTIVWAVDTKGIGTPPDVVISGANLGQNISKPIVDVSGTVGAARAAAQRGIPALAVSAGFGATFKTAAYGLAAKQAVAWLTKNRAALPTAKATVTNLNTPTCLTGKPKALVIVKIAPAIGDAFKTPDCVTASPKPTTDVDGLSHGYIVQTNNVPLKPAK
jgi:5'-nucleotidase